VGTFGDKAAIVVIDGSEPRSVRVGNESAGVRVISVERDRAILEFDGQRHTLVRGQFARSGEGSGRPSVTLSADARGHFVSEGAVNGAPIRFVVDTGATLVALPASEANRIGIDYRKARIVITHTAAGAVPVYQVRFDSVRVGDIELAGVDGVVVESGLDVALLGMSFLRRVEMRNDGQLMVLTRRY